MTHRSLAAVFSGKPEELALHPFDTPVPGRGETLVRVIGCTLCGSDLHSYEGRRQVPVPTILGHEIVGAIEAFGPEAPQVDWTGRELRPGDRVTWAIVASCGQCHYCHRGLPQKCERGVKYGHERFAPGVELRGGLADHCLLAPGSAVLRVPDELPLEVACPASCATATVAAALSRAGGTQGRTVAILGAGLLGLTACAMSRAGGAGAIVCVDRDASRRERALLFGASHSVAPEEAPAALRDVSGGYGVDLLVELTGARAAFLNTWDSVRLGGAIVLVGSVFPDEPVPMRLEQIVRRNLSIFGVHNYGPADLAAALEFLARHHAGFPFRELVAAWYPLQDCAAAFTAARDPAAIRIGVRPGG
ncbi:MAG: L-threonine 3-dehydrogenase [Planctomycetota bacterium]|jgi:putative phosphonate catabolism associated alcohol dehydrogenase